MFYQRNRMSDILLSNSDQNIYNIIEEFDVVITETVYTEEGRLKLNYEQVQSEIGNLLASKLPLSKLINKIKCFTQLFYNTQKLPNIDTILPIVDTNKYMLEDDLKPPFYYKINLDLDPENKIKGQKLIDFIDVYANLNRERDNRYIDTSRLLYRHFQPIDFTGKTLVKEYTDVILSDRPQPEIFRAIPKVQIDVGYRPDFIDPEYLKEFKCPQGRKYIERSQYETIYEGDRMNIFGYMNIVGSNVSSAYETVNFKKYYAMLESIEVGTKVTILFNTLVLDYRNHIIDDVSGIVAIVDPITNQITIELDKQIQIGDFVGRQLECPTNNYVPFFVYPTDFEPKFSKKKLLTHNYKFLTTNKSLIYPLNWSEYAYIYSDKIHTYNNLQKYIPFNARELEMLPLNKRFVCPSRTAVFKNYVHSKKSHPYVSTIDFLDFDKHSDLLKDYDISSISPYLHKNTFIDTELNRLLYLTKLPLNGLLYFFKYAQLKRKKHSSEEIEALLDEVNQALKKPKAKNRIQDYTPQLAKEYRDLADLEKDNGIYDDNTMLYFDSKYDKTKYDLKEKYDRPALLMELKDEFEVQCIFDKKRPLRSGDLAILKQHSHPAAYYKWVKIQNKYMWVKTSNLPPVCKEEKLPKFEDIIGNKAMILDTFDDICKKAEDIRENHEYMHLLSAINILESFMEENTEEAIENNKELIKRLELSTLASASAAGPAAEGPVNTMFGYVDKVAYDEYFGTEDMYNLDNMFMNFEYDQTPTAMNYRMPPTAAEVAQADKRNILDIICKVLEIEELDDNDKTDISDYIDTKYPDEIAYQLIKRKTEDLNTFIEKLLKENKKKSPRTFNEMKEKLEATKQQKIQDETFKILSSHYFDKITSCIAILNLYIMIKHPNIVIKRLIPACVKYFSYSGYPLLKDDDQTRSLVKYMACVLKSLYQPKDIRFGLFNDLDENIKAITIKIKMVLLERYDIKKTLEKTTEKAAAAAAAAHKTGSKHINAIAEYMDFTDTYGILNTFYKPCFDFAYGNYKNPVIRYMKVINDHIKTSKMSRFNIVNIPMISNTCCMEMLLKTTNFYDYFHSTDLDSIYKTLPKDTLNKKTLSNLWIPPSKLQIKEDLFLKNKLEIKGTNPEKLPVLGDTSPGEARDEDWWNDELHPKIKEMFAFIKSKCADTQARAYAQTDSMFINIEVLDDIMNLKIIYANYIRGEMRSTLGKLLNLYKYNKKEKINRADPFVILLESLYDIQYIDLIFNRIGRELPTLCNQIVYDSESHSVNNIMWYSYQLCQFFMKALWIAATDADLPSPEITIEDLSYHINTSTRPAYIKKVSEIINLLLVNLDAYVNMNYFDISSLKKEVEILREKRKEEIMAGYSADDEHRNLQKILKVMGLNIMGKGPSPDNAALAAVEEDGLNEGAAEAPAPLVDVVEAEYGNYVDDVGENADGDIEYDGYD